MNKLLLGLFLLHNFKHEQAVAILLIETIIDESQFLWTLLLSFFRNANGTASFRVFQDAKPGHDGHEWLWPTNLGSHWRSSDGLQRSNAKPVLLRSTSGYSNK